MSEKRHHPFITALSAAIAARCFPGVLGEFRLRLHLLGRGVS